VSSESILDTEPEKHYRVMTVRSAIARLTEHEGINFALTNRIPRRALTRFAGWFSKIEQPAVRDLSIAAWRLFCDVDLSDARKTEFRSLHDCFIRELKDDARPIDPAANLLVSPCDGIVGASGAIADGLLLQVKGSAYGLDELLRDPALVALCRNGRYVTLRLTAGMYHRFHAPHACHVNEVAHIAGDAWNVNPATLKRVDKIYCRNERAILRLDIAGGGSVILVAVAAVLVAGIRLRFLEFPTDGRKRDWSTRVADVRLAKGEEMGWFEHGSTIIVLTPDGYDLCSNLTPGHTIRMGEPIARVS
jgi:phosphatidylserine decarboxylase